MTSTCCDSAISSARNAALAYMGGVTNGWTYRAFQEWYLRHLVVTGRMRPSSSWNRVTLREAGVGNVELVDNLWLLPTRERLVVTARFHLALVAAHTRVLNVLRRFLVTRSIDFVHAALYGGRLERELTTSADAGWLVVLDDRAMLSECVLALFAADYMQHPNDYLRGLGICRICDRIRFSERQLFRTLCAAHGATWLTLHGASGVDVPPVSGVFLKEDGATAADTVEASPRVCEAGGHPSVRGAR